MNIPASTYRVQLHKGFTLNELFDIIDYLEALGVSTIYAAPILKSNPGSVHGYDVVDPHLIDPEIGTIADLRKIARALEKKNMNWLQDIVPNHMAFSVSNTRLMDVLERGPLSPYYQYFDIDWNHDDPSLEGKLQVPFLGKELDQCIEDGEITIDFGSNGFVVNYLKTLYPLSVQAYAYLFSLDPQLKDDLRLQIPVFRKSSLPSWRLKKQIFINGLLLEQKIHTRVRNLLSRINDDSKFVKEILSRQNYVLAYWKESSHRINYRRFFTVNELICLRMEEDKVFEEYHQFLKVLQDKNYVQGFRIDHIDGLRSPAGYTRKLRQLMGADAYIIAEKILESHERIPESWPIEGTSGYEFLAFVNQLLTDRNGAKELLKFYQSLFPNLPPYKEIVLHNKRKILKEYMAGEWQNLSALMDSLDLAGGIDPERLKAAVGIFMVYFPVYRIYPEKLPLAGADLELVGRTFQSAIEQNAGYQNELQFLRNLFLEKQEAQISGAALQFLQRLMQFTGPLTAKGVEDTTFYIYNPLISHDEVGDSPSELGISIRNFHSRMVERQKFTPYSLNTTSTHDTKRGEDARVRLNVLGEFSTEWIALVNQWMELNKKYKRDLNGKSAPSLNDEYFIYQSIVAGFPEDMAITNDFIERLQTYLTKVVREAKLFSDWSDPDEMYEKACKDFVASILNDQSDFLKTLLPFMSQLIDRASIYALSQLTIKLTAPGVPDTYQGCELWDLSFVDPDNRRPVDFEKRRSLMNQLLVQEKKGIKNLQSFVSQHRVSGVEKMFVTMKVLNFRKKYNSVFIEGEYLPLDVTSRQTVAISYARRAADKWLLIIVPLGKRDSKAAFEDNLNEDYILLPENSPDHWTDVVTGETIQTQRKLLLSRCLNGFPVSVLTNL